MVNQKKTTPAQLRIEKDLNELDIPSTIKLKILDSSKMNFEIIIKPDEGYYQKGSFKFQINLNNNFPIDAPKVKCLNKIYHPNIDLDGNICLNILREDWSPVLNLNSILVGLLFLFLEPNPNDPLNKESASILIRDKNLFKKYVNASLSGGSFDGVRYDYVL
ncbi:NEDD8-conjugating enzyme UBC12 [Wickerhamomyces ciferrii]|uniref:NEDD8-conjugating enzyme UBC12 n=1 Tax=Wickerhamomyces ciferrii (strain ATCC 14091 / BCRC 22168 / CBS 111 / JCM 3599 / NBRC 0793 / NRRL Y-1031 F-60-10) TaxID=1206466 RepID=K0KKI2_WICCF|nr:NEDD8-conjugating enzyme UBC12 [Wickerhamomyces ciferrii]CCH45715.1 NEDD8-conjugating enzyme UBC12 [Wickerhamomyces ciferrii]